MWADASKLTVEQIERELTEVAAKARNANANGSQIGELSSRLWRLRAELRFRERSE
jgi:hypothetical protein